MLKDKLDLKENNKGAIVSIKNNMNSKRSFKERWDFFDNIESKILNNEWVQAFIDGEGCFQFGIADPVSRGKPYVALTPTLAISQSNHDIKLLNAFKHFFGCGYLKPKYDITDIDAAKSSHSVNRYLVNQHSAVTEFIDKYPMLTCKQLDYLDWKKLIQLKAERAHDTPGGRLEMETIKSQMNRNRCGIFLGRDP